MSVKSRGTKAGPWGLLSSLRLPLILLAMLTLYRLCIKPNKSFHLLWLIYTWAWDFLQSIFFFFCLQLLTFIKKWLCRSLARFLPLCNNIDVCEVNPKHLLSEIKTFYFTQEMLYDSLMFNNHQCLLYKLIVYSAPSKVTSKMPACFNW